MQFFDRFDTALHAYSNIRWTISGIGEVEEVVMAEVEGVTEAVEVEDTGEEEKKDLFQMNLHSLHLLGTYLTTSCKEMWTQSSRTCKLGVCAW